MKLRRSTLIPLLLLAYLGVMSWIGLDELRAGHYLYYFGIIIASLVCIALLHIRMRRRENKKQQ